MWVASHEYHPHVDGAPVRLSIDMAIQRYVEHRLESAVSSCNAGGGRAIVVDPASGEILALADIITKREGWPGQPEDPLRDNMIVSAAIDASAIPMNRDQPSNPSSGPLPLKQDLQKPRKSCQHQRALPIALPAVAAYVMCITTDR